MRHDPSQPGKRIAVITGSRAEFGLLQPVMQAIAEHPNLTLQTVVAGSHWISHTWQDITDAGFAIDAKVKMQRPGATGRQADAMAVARGMRGFTRAFVRLQPDVVLVLGDRIEAFAAASAASVGGWVLAHVHGGDRAEGVADEAMRHAISKLTHVHLPATAQSAERLIRMGESSASVHVVGSPAMDELDSIPPAADAPDVLVLQHPVGDSATVERQRMALILEATRDAALGRRVVLMPNLDAGREGIVQAIEMQADAHACEVVEHLPRRKFVAWLKSAKVLVGNSSAGLIEAAATRTPCVNVGRRQQGRETPEHVITLPQQIPTLDALRHAIHQARQMDLTHASHPYGDGRTGPAIADLLHQLDTTTLPLKKCNTY